MQGLLIITLGDIPSTAKYETWIISPYEPIAATTKKG